MLCLLLNKSLATCTRYQLRTSKSKPRMLIIAWDFIMFSSSFFLIQIIVSPENWFKGRLVQHVSTLAVSGNLSLLHNDLRCQVPNPIQIEVSNFTTWADVMKPEEIRNVQSLRLLRCQRISKMGFTYGNIRLHTKLWIKNRDQCILPSVRERHPRPHHKGAAIIARRQGSNWRSNDCQPDALTIRPRHPCELQTLQLHTDYICHIQAQKKNKLHTSTDYI